MFEREVVTEQWLQDKKAVEYDGKFYLHGHCQANEVTLCFFRDAIQAAAIDRWCIIDREARPAVWLPTNRVEDFGNQRILVSRFWATVHILEIVFKT